MRLPKGKLIAALGLISCILVILWFNFKFWPLSSIARDDDIYYINSGMDLVSGRYVETRMPPFYPLLIGLLTQLTGDGFLSARLISAFFGCFLILPLYLLTKKIYSKNTALLSVLLLAVFPYRIILSNAAKSESLYLFLVVASACLFFYLAEKQKISLFISSALGLLLSALYLTRPEGLCYIIIFLGYLFIAKNTRSSRAMKINAAIFVAIFILFLIPYVLFLHQQTGRWTLSGKDDNLLFSDWVSRGGQWQQLNKLSDNGRDIIFVNPYSSLKEAVIYSVNRYISNFYIMLGVLAKIFSPLIFILFGIGLFESLKNTSERANKFFLLIFVLPIFIYPFFHVKGDYLYPALFPIIIIAVDGLLCLCGHIKAGKVFLFGTVLLIVLIFSQDFRLLANKISSELQVEKKTIGLWMKNNLPEGKVMDIEPISAFYAKMPYVMFPYSSFALTMDYAQKNGVEYIILTERDRDKYNPEIARLFDLEDIPGNLEFIKKYSMGNKFNAILFKLKNKEKLLWQK